MRRILAIALLALAIATPASAHHVKVAAADSDVEAFASYYAEYIAQDTGVLELYREYVLAPSGIEKSDLALELQTALETSIVHMESLDVRECFRPITILVVEQFDALARYFAVIADSPPLGTVILQSAGGIWSAIRSEVAPTLVECSPEAALT
jgi:hypothetical protein